jgi:hypothetical protein
MKALTVQQPWAWAIIHGTKRIENRTTAWKYRGPLAIHAGTRWSERGARSGLVWADLLSLYGWPAGPDAARRDPRPGFAPIRPDGMIIGTVNLIDVHVASPEHIGAGGLRVDFCCDSPWAETSYTEHGGKVRRQITHLVLADPEPLAEPIPCKGALGLWTPDPHAMERLSA